MSIDNQKHDTWLALNRALRDMGLAVVPLGVEAAAMAGLTPEAVAARLALMAGAGAAGVGLYSYLSDWFTTDKLHRLANALVDEVAAAGLYKGTEKDQYFASVIGKCQPEVRDLLWDMHRTALQSKSDSATRLMLVLTSDRMVFHGGVPNEFTRRAATLLERMEDADQAYLRKLLLVCKLEMGQYGAQIVAQSGARVNVQPHPANQAGAVNEFQSVTGPDFSRVVHALGLLESTRFAINTNGSTLLLRENTGGHLEALIALFERGLVET